MNLTDRQMDRQTEITIPRAPVRAKKFWDDPPDLLSKGSFQVDIKRRDLKKSTMIEKNIIK